MCNWESTTDDDLGNAERRTIQERPGQVADMSALNTMPRSDLDVFRPGLRLDGEKQVTIRLYEPR
jgi:hypothetical protein